MLRALRYALALIACLGGPALAQDHTRDLPLPKGDVILTVSGAIGITNVGNTAQFDLAMLEALKSETFETTTIWTEGTERFKGVPLNVLAKRLGFTGQTLRATAINDYAIEIPMSDAVEGGPILAYLMNGEVMSVRDNGPLWVVYPFDRNPDYRSEVIYSRSIWQLDRIEVLN
ncbi:molybdopterin-dependent oxidoreductase [Thioclava indica]|uniref:Oxidoreductase molybdopterin-binding domain-containing protein n=1 Tax=Thioclava indica TaxID=1353528 RepID=A0A074JP25_9RHOB|nr:molybdopterin-dependent oxidoreductase [Thioclava indica]KEO58229.1 hypothetical protein DT23_16645 [Thioclava indica]